MLNELNRRTVGERKSKPATLVEGVLLKPVDMLASTPLDCKASGPIDTPS